MQLIYYAYLLFKIKEVEYNDIIDFKINYCIDGALTLMIPLILHI